jgi:hypothetical protein
MRNPDLYDDPELEEIERLLLKAGRAGPPLDAKHRALAAVSSVMVASSLATGQAAAASVGAKGVALLSTKWLVVLSVTGAVAVSGGVAVRQMQTSRVVPSAPARSAQAIRGPATVSSSMRLEVQPPASAVLVVAPAESVVSRPIASIQPPATPPTQFARVSASPMPTFSVEVSTLDQARAAIADDEPARALSILDEYAGQFPRGTMEPEASVLRIEALLRAGDRSAAERAAHAFLRTNPSSPYGRRVQSLLGSNP